MRLGWALNPSCPSSRMKVPVQILPGPAVGPWKCCFSGWQQGKWPGLRIEDPVQEPLAAPVNELQGWAELFWPESVSQILLPELMTAVGIRRYTWWYKDNERCLLITYFMTTAKKVIKIVTSYVMPKKNISLMKESLPEQHVRSWCWWWCCSSESAGDAESW